LARSQQPRCSFTWPARAAPAPLGLVRDVAFRPRRLKSCQIPRKPRTDGLRSRGSTRSETVTHPFARLAPRPPIKEASAGAELDPPALIEPDGREHRRTRDASGRFLHPTFSKTSTRATCGCRRTRRITDGMTASRRPSHFGWRPLAHVAFLAPVTRSKNQPLTPPSPASGLGRSRANQPASTVSADSS
jgi:hypothetical protein